jgi:hypothetical protein
MKKSSSFIQMDYYFLYWEMNWRIKREVGKEKKTHTEYLGAGIAGILKK